MSLGAVTLLGGSGVSSSSVGGSATWGTTVGETDVASAAPDLTVVTTAGVRFTGTSAMTGAGFGTVAAGTAFLCRAAGASSLTYNATSLILPTAASITLAAGDAFTLVSLGSGNWRAHTFMRADGTPLAVGANLNYGTNPGEIVIADCSITAASATGTAHGYKVRGDGVDIWQPYFESDGAGGIQNYGVKLNGVLIGTSTAAYAAGTAYSFTNSSAAVDMGTTDPSITLTAAGKWKITACVQVAYAAATVVAETLALKLRRTNNTAADLTSSSITVDLPTATTLTYTYGTVRLPAIYYTTSNSNDVVTIFGNVSATLGAGTINAEAGGTWIEAERIS